MIKEQVKKEIMSEKSIELKEVEKNTITFTVNNGVTEVLKFKEDKLELYGKEVEVDDPRVIEGLRAWLEGSGFIKPDNNE